MRHWSDEIIRETRDFFRTHFARELSTDEVVESLGNICDYVDLLRDYSDKREERQEETPDRG